VQHGETLARANIFADFNEGFINDPSQRTAYGPIIKIQLLLGQFRCQCFTPVPEHIQFFIQDLEAVFFRTGFTQP